jgi:hypothetical protein
MVGVDEHAYSDYALVWLLESLVDDGDEVVCVRVIETPVRGGDKGYQAEAKRMMQTITEKNTQNRAISIVLEYSVGKLHATFQQLVRLRALHAGDGVVYRLFDSILTRLVRYRYKCTNRRCSS